MLDEIRKSPTFPDEIQTVGAVRVAWGMVTPRTAFILTDDGGTPEDRTFAAALVEARLSAFNIDRFEIPMDGSHDFRRTAAWSDIMQKAKRLNQQGNVDIVNNGYTEITGTVTGDTGVYDTTIKRQDPSSRSISQWHCSCPWGETFAWDRTRQWKKYEGRPCAHTLALYWRSLATPLDDDGEERAYDPGQKQGPREVAPPEMPADVPDTMQRSFGPDDPSPMYQPTPDMPGEDPSEIPEPMLPQSPADQYAEMMPPESGQTPAGMPAPNNSVSVPGAAPPSPGNPLQYPGEPGVGGTLSSVRTASFESSEVVRLVKPVIGMAEGKSEEHGAGQYQEVEEGATGEVVYQDDTLGWVEVIFPLDGGNMTPYHVRVFCDPTDLKKTRIKSPGPFRTRHQ